MTGGTGPTSDYTDWELNYVRSNTTLMIGTGQTFPTLAAAWTYTLNAKIADGSYLHLYISSANGDFDEQFSAPLLLDQASGSRIAILGDSQTKDTIDFNNTNGLIIDTAHSINTLSGFTLSNEGNPSNSYDGLKINSQANITAVSNLTISDFGNCVYAAQDSSASIDSGTQLEHFVNAGLWADSNATILVPAGLTITGDGSNTGTALLAQHGGFIEAGDGITISECTNGIVAFQGGIVVADEANISSSGQDGCWANVRGLVVLLGCTISTSVNLDVEADSGSIVYATASTFTLSGYDNHGSYIIT